MTGPFEDRFREIVEALFGRPFSDEDGISESELDDIQRLNKYEMPEALRHFYAVVGNFVPVMEAHNIFQHPAALSRQDDMLVFCTENQAVVYWGYLEDEGWRADPPVFQGINDNGEVIEWHKEPVKFSDFLKGMIYWQALNGGLEHSRFASAPELVRQKTGGWPLVFDDGDDQFFSRGSVVFAFLQSDEGVQVQAAAMTESELDSVMRMLGIEKWW